jgi:hypothetical protein
MIVEPHVSDEHFAQLPQFGPRTDLVPGFSVLMLLLTRTALAVVRTAGAIGVWMVFAQIPEEFPDLPRQGLAGESVTGHWSMSASSRSRRARKIANAGGKTESEQEFMAGSLRVMASPITVAVKLPQRTKSVRAFMCSFRRMSVRQSRPVQMPCRERLTNDESVGPPQ